MIEIKDMNFGYVPQRRIFDNLNLSLEAGHIYGLLGKNGVGKTTLLKIISGLRFCNSGTVSVFGMKPEKRNPEMLADIYFVTEEMDVPSVSVHDYAKIYAPFYPNFSISDFENYLHQFEIVDMEQKLTSMSHGQKKKVLVSFALATNTKLLIMDEPTNGMDIPSKSTFRKVVASAITDDKAFIISTHQVRDLQNVIDAAEALPGLFHLPVVPAFYIRDSVNKGLQHIIEGLEHLNSRLHCVGRDAVLVESLSLMQVRNTGAVRSKHVSHRIEFEDLLRQSAKRPSGGDNDIHALIGRRLQGFPVSFT